MSNWVKYYKGNPFIPKDFQKKKKKNVARHCPLLVNDTHCLQLLENKRKYIIIFKHHCPRHNLQNILVSLDYMGMTNTHKVHVLEKVYAISGFFTTTNTEH